MGPKLTCSNYHLARLHSIHPTPSYASAIRLLARSSKLAEQAASSLFSSGLQLAEEITPIPRENVEALQKRVVALEVAAKRALFAERVEKPVFFDTAFNYVELPMDELLVRAGKEPQGQHEAEGQGQGVLAQAAKAVQSVAPAAAVERVKGVVRSTRESTPAVQAPTAKAGSRQAVQMDDDDDEEEEEEGAQGQAQGQRQGKKGWLGGWFGRG
jgi:signal recognition particle subunit SRP68